MESWHCVGLTGIDACIASATGGGTVHPCAVSAAYDQLKELQKKEIN